MSENREVKGYIIVDTNGKYLRTSQSSTHTGFKDSHHWYEDINSAEMFVNPRRIKDLLKDASGAAGVLPAIETRSITISEFETPKKTNDV